MHPVHALYFTQFDTYKEFYSPWYEKTNQKRVKLDGRWAGVTCAILSTDRKTRSLFINSVAFLRCALTCFKSAFIPFHWLHTGEINNVQQGRGS